MVTIDMTFITVFLFVRLSTNLTDMHVARIMRFNVTIKGILWSKYIIAVSALKFLRVVFLDVMIRHFSLIQKTYIAFLAKYNVFSHVSFGMHSVSRFRVGSEVAFIAGIFTFFATGKRFFILIFISHFTERGRNWRIIFGKRKWFRFSFDQLSFTFRRIIAITLFCWIIQWFGFNWLSLTVSFRLFTLPSRRNGSFSFYRLCPSICCYVVPLPLTIICCFNFSRLISSIFRSTVTFSSR